MLSLRNIIGFIILFRLIEGNLKEQCSNKGEIEGCKKNEENLFLKQPNSGISDHKDDILVYTVATEETDGYERYLYSARQYKIKPKVLGMGQQWKGGEDIKHRPGGGWKINLLKSDLEQFKETNKIILFTDAYDVMFLANLNNILSKFHSMNDVRVLFGAESSCWPNPDLADKYPKVADKGKRYLNSGLYMGYAKELWEILNRETIKDADDDQLYFTKAYLDEKLREKTKFKLDHKSEIFQNLNGAISDIEIFHEKPKDDEPEIYKIKNVETRTEPLIVHGNGPSKLTLNYLSNYLANNWNSVNGCVRCKEGVIDLSDRKPNEMPLLNIGIFIESPTPFLEEQLNKIYEQKYPKERINLFIHNAAKFHMKHVKEFIDNYGKEYLSVKEVKPDDGYTEWAARDLSLDHCLAKNCDIYVSVDSIAHLDNPNTIKLLIEQNRTIVAPLMSRPGKAWSNFWGALNKDGYYSRANDYMDIVHNEKRGLWNVPYVANAYVVNSKILKKYDRKQITYSRDSLDTDMAFCANIRDLDIFMYVTNRIDFGHLIDPDTFDTTRTEPEMYQLFDNQLDWEQRYIHKDYPEQVNPDTVPAQPCPDVYWFPVVTQRFCTSLIKMMESFGKWSDGTNYDNRLEGGYEAVPTRDIHMTQVGWDAHWLEFLRRYVMPLQEKVFTGYYQDPPRSLMNFVVRYRPDEQPNLRPHHDTSTYTINVALNQVGVDYEGGGCRFIRYNCSVTDTKPGWLLMHPGRLTHYHEGLYVTKGTRYIMVSFVNP